MYSGSPSKTLMVESAAEPVNATAGVTAAAASTPARPLNARKPTRAGAHPHLMRLLPRRDHSSVAAMIRGAADASGRRAFRLGAERRSTELWTEQSHAVAELVAQLDERLELFRAEAPTDPARDGLHVVHRHAPEHVVPGVGEADHGAARVRRLGLLGDQPARHQPVDQAADAGLGEEDVLVEVA